MKKILLLICFAVVHTSAKAQKFEFNYLQSGSITFVEWFTEELEGLGEKEPVTSFVEFSWNEKKLIVVGKINNGDILFEFGRQKGNVFNYSFSENAIYIKIGTEEDIKTKEVYDGIATIEVIPKETKFDVFFPPIEDSEVEHHELIRFLDKDDGNQNQAYRHAYNQLLKKLQDAGFDEEHWY